MSKSGAFCRKSFAWDFFFTCKLFLFLCFSLLFSGFYFNEFFMATYGQLIIDFYTRFIDHQGPKRMIFNANANARRERERETHEKSNKNAINSGDQFSKYNINKKCNLSMLCLSIRLFVCPIYWVCVCHVSQSVSQSVIRSACLMVWRHPSGHTGAQKRAINCTTKSNMQTLTETVETCTCRAICHMPYNEGCLKRLANNG